MLHHKSGKASYVIKVRLLTFLQRSLTEESRQIAVKAPNNYISCIEDEDKAVMMLVYKINVLELAQALAGQDFNQRTCISQFMERVKGGSGFGCHNKEDVVHCIEELDKN